MLAVDTNVLVYAHRREVREHAAALRVVRELAEGQTPWAIPWPCIYEFFSVVTNARIWKERATDPARAWAQIEAWLGSPSLRLLSETEDFSSVLAAFLKHPRVRGPVVHDARIAALCVAHGVDALLTRDRDLSLFDELRLRNPFV
jgi:toxin-antitoxin system PIN domain toxin